jgi:hypothetical protein|tara:strand:+ start:58 stop:273 length:216 start_codon:yes stop_codon:yes gene_type:complete
MGEVIKFPETQGDYMSILVGEDVDGETVICIEQCESDGTTAHINAIHLDVKQLDILIYELTIVSSMFVGKH